MSHFHSPSLQLSQIDFLVSSSFLSLLYLSSSSISSDPCAPYSILLLIQRAVLLTWPTLVFLRLLLHLPRSHSHYLLCRLEPLPLLQPPPRYLARLRPPGADDDLEKPLLMVIKGQIYDVWQNIYRKDKITFCVFYFCLFVGF